MHEKIVDADAPIESKLRLKRFMLLVVIPIIAAIVVGAIYLSGGRIVETDNSYVKADKVPVSAEVSGMIKQVLVEENQLVLAGQPLFRLDAAPFQIEVAKAEATLAQMRVDLAATKASFHEKQAEITLARSRYAFVGNDLRRQAELAEKQFISASKLDEATQNRDLAEQQINVLQHDLRRIAETLGGSVDAPAENHPSYLAALAVLDRARLDLARTEVRASLSGTVSRLPKPGQYTAAGTIAMILVASDNLWVEANFTETDFTFVQRGQPVVIHVDTYPDASWQGVVESLSPATGAEFSVIPAQNATGNWVKISQRVPVRIKLKVPPGLPQLRAGLSAITKIDTGHHRLLLGFSL